MQQSIKEVSLTSEGNDDFTSIMIQHKNIQ